MTGLGVWPCPSLTTITRTLGECLRDALMGCIRRVERQWLVECCTDSVCHNYAPSFWANGGQQTCRHGQHPSRTRIPACHRAAAAAPQTQTSCAAAAKPQPPLAAPPPVTATATTPALTAAAQALATTATRPSLGETWLSVDPGISADSVVVRDILTL